MRHAPHFQRNEGFTLIEVLAALLLASFAVLTISNLFVFATNQVRLAREDTGAALYAQKKIEELMMLNRGASALAAGQYSDSPAPRYLRQWRIYDNNPAPGSKLIVVKVTPGQGRSPRPVVFAAIRAR